MHMQMAMVGNRLIHNEHTHVSPVVITVMVSRHIESVTVVCEIAEDRRIHDSYESVFNYYATITVK